MSEENTLFIPVGESCQRNLITCGMSVTVADAAVTMRDRCISSIIVCDEQGEAVGVMTDHDLRSKVVAGRLDPDQTSVGAVMHSPLVCVQEQDILFEALYQMSRHRIRRVGVVDADGKLVGIINESDVLRLQQHSPQRLLRATDEARSVAELKTLHEDTEQLVVYLSRAGVRTRDLVRLIAVLNDHICRRLIHLLQQQQFPDLPEGVAFLVLGSEGRREQTLKTDQDNAIIYSETLSEEEVERVKAFSHALIEALIEIGVPECPGGIMARNDFWRRSLSGWQKAVDGWIAEPSGENILNFGMFSDLRTVWGDESLEQNLREHIVKRSRENGLFLSRMAANVCRFPPPIGFLGRIKMEKSGVHAGKVDLKKAGLFALAEGVKTLALEAGWMGGNTHEKLKILGQKGVLPSNQVNDLSAAFSLLSFFRLRGQVESVVRGLEPHNYVSPASLNRVEKARLQTTLEVVRSFQDTLRTHFQVNLLVG